MGMKSCLICNELFSDNTKNGSQKYCTKLCADTSYRKQKKEEPSYFSECPKCFEKMKVALPVIKFENWRNFICKCGNRITKKVEVLS